MTLQEAKYSLSIIFMVCVVCVIPYFQFFTTVFFLGLAIISAGKIKGIELSIISIYLIFIFYLSDANSAPDLIGYNSLFSDANQTGFNTDIFSEPVLPFIYHVVGGLVQNWKAIDVFDVNVVLLTISILLFLFSLRYRYLCYAVLASLDPFLTIHLSRQMLVIYLVLSAFLLFRPIVSKAIFGFGGILIHHYSVILLPVAVFMKKDFNHLKTALLLIPTNLAFLFLGPLLLSYTIPILLENSLISNKILFFFSIESTDSSFQVKHGLGLLSAFIITLFYRQASLYVVIFLFYSALYFLCKEISWLGSRLGLPAIGILTLVPVVELGRRLIVKKV